jgi:hypothetical protein
MVGRFIGEDAIGFGAGDGNLYRYVYNSTINRTDPMGMQVVAPPPPVAPLITPIATPWYTPILRIAPLITIPLSIPGGLLNPTTTNPYEFPDEIPNPNACPIPKMQRKKRCEFKYEIPGRPDYAFKVCAYDCKGYGALATFSWPNDLPFPESFDGLFPRIPPGYPDPNMPRM